MPVTLRVSSHQRPALGRNASRVFERGGTIGRLPDNDWVLPDPEKVVSGHHAEISLQNNTYFLTDRSTNGTVVNGLEIPKGNPVPLRNGDVVTIGSYEIEVVVEAAGAERNAFGLQDAAANVDDLLGAGDESKDPLKFFEPDDDWASRTAQPQRAQWDHAAPESDVFVPPPVTTQGVPEIPVDWDKPEGDRHDLFDSGFSGPSDPGPPEHGFFDADSPEPDFGLGVSGHRAGLPDSARAGQGRVQASPESSFPFTGSASTPDSPSSSAERRPDLRTAQDGSLAQPVPAGDSRGGLGGVSTDLEALFRAAGIEPTAVDERVLASLGEILHVVVEGLVDVLRARAEIKNQFRVPMTTLKVSENNPLKFSANANDALFNLFGRRNAGFSEPVDAFREAFADLKAHQFAMLAGMRSAFDALLKRFDPDGLQESFDRGMKRGALLDVMNKTKYWELYREMYAELGNDDTTFRRLFGDEFAQAYEEQMQRLSAAPRRGQ